MNNKKKKILIIEDSPEISKVVSLTLTDAGYETDSALNGKEGVKKAEKNSYDLILLDLVMPGKSGFEVLNELRMRGITTPIIVYSNMLEFSTREEAIKMGASDYFEKATTSLSEIVEHIENFLNS
jgi:DNA-binding response OmpR family regulator